MGHHQVIIGRVSIVPSNTVNFDCMYHYYRHFPAYSSVTSLPPRRPSNVYQYHTRHAVNKYRLGLGRQHWVMSILVREVYFLITSLRSSPAVIRHACFPCRFTPRFNAVIANRSFGADITRHFVTFFSHVGFRRLVIGYAINTATPACIE